MKKNKYKFLIKGEKSFATSFWRYTLFPFICSQVLIPAMYMGDYGLLAPCVVGIIATVYIFYACIGALKSSFKYNGNKILKYLGIICIVIILIINSYWFMIVYFNANMLYNFHLMTSKW